MHRTPNPQHRLQHPIGRQRQIGSSRDEPIIGGKVTSSSRSDNGRVLRAAAKEVQVVEKSGYRRFATTLGYRIITG